jgi:8-oxo-dGTP diphosphatase
MTNYRIMKKEKDFYQVSLKLFLKNKKGEVLVLKAVDNGSFAGYYDLPGGRIHTDEFKTDFIDILKREVKEEIGNLNFNINNKPAAVGRHLISASVSKSGKDIHVLYIFFEAEYLEGDVVISDEHTGLKWLNLKEVRLEEYFISGILDGVKIFLGI